MNILFIVPEKIGDNTSSGVSTYTDFLSHELTKKGHNVTVLFQCDENIEYTKKSIIHLVPLWEHPKTGTNFFFRLTRKIFSKNFPKLIHHIAWNLSVFYFVQEQTRQFDIIECPEWGASTLLLSIFTRIPTIVRLHRGWYLYKIDNNLKISIDDWLVIILEFFTISKATGLTAPSSFIFKKYKQLLFWNDISNKIHQIIPNGVGAITSPRKKFSLVLPKKYFLFASRIETAKGVFLLVDAFARIASEFPQTNLVIVGKSVEMIEGSSQKSSKDSLIELIEKKCLTNQVIMFESVLQADLVPFYRNCMFLVLPSMNNENFPMSLLEAQQFNKPLLGSNAGGIPEIIKEGKNGLLFESNNSKMLGDKIRILLQNEKIRLKISKYIATHKSQFSIENTTKKTIQFYLEFINHRKN